MSNEFKLSHGSRERKRRQSITLTAIEIERLASEGAHCFHFILHNSSFNLFIRRLGVGYSVWLGVSMPFSLRLRRNTSFQVGRGFTNFLNALAELLARLGWCIEAVSGQIVLSDPLG
jgi:hypothetical protein